MRVPLRQWLSLLTVIAAMSSVAPAAVSYPESTEGLARLIEDTFAALKTGDTDRAKELIRSMELPDQQAWFRKTFGDDLGAAIAVEYGRRAPSMEHELTRSFEDRIEDRRTFVTAIKIESPDDDNATGLQKMALQNMRSRVPLYTVKLGDRPGGTGYSIWSWVYVRGTFRIAGKMDVFRNNSTPPAAAAPTEAPAPADVPAPAVLPALTPPATAPIAAAAPAETAPVANPLASAPQPPEDAHASPPASALKKVFEELLAALQTGRDNEAAAIVRSMMLTDSEKWFGRTFGEATGKALAENYLAELAAGMETEMLDDIRAQIAKGRTQVIAYRVEGADDPKAEERQRVAINRMVTRQTLYGVRLTEPGVVTGTHYRSFVYVDGKFRLVGKLDIGR
jgi:hypothetical protein